MEDLNVNMEPHPRGKLIHRIPEPGKVRDAFRIRPLPLQWFRGIGSAISAGVPVFIGALTGHMDLGMCASIGGFAFLYVGNETYRQRALKLLLVALGMTLAFGLGNLTSTVSWLMVILFGLIGAVAVFWFGAFQVTGPSAMFFILTFSVGTSMPFDLSAIPVRVGFMLLGGLFAWIVGMAGWLIGPHRPETKAVANAYVSLAAFLDSIGKENHHDAQYKAASALRTAEHIVSGGELRWRRDYRPARRLWSLTRKANEMFMTIVELSQEKPQPLEAELAASIRSIAAGIQGPHQLVPVPDVPWRAANEPLQQLARLLKEVQTILDQTDEAAGQAAVQLPKQKIRLILAGAWGRHSTLKYTALRYGIMIMAAAAVAYSLHLNRSYWVPLSCSAVMLGTTVIGTMHRSLQRMLGTLIGIVVGGVILSFRPEGIYVALAMAALQFIVELIYLRNYAIAVMFITPSTLLIAESTNPDKAMSFFMSARVLDILIGSAIGLIGTYLLWRSASSSRLPRALADVIRMEGKLLEQLLSGQRQGSDRVEPAALETSLIKLRLLYDSAFAESVGKREGVSSLWPAVASSFHVGYILIAASSKDEIWQESRETMTLLTDGFRQMADAAERHAPPQMFDIPKLESLPSLHSEVSSLHEALQIGDRSLQEAS